MGLNVNIDKKLLIVTKIMTEPKLCLNDNRVAPCKVYNFYAD